MTQVVSAVQQKGGAGKTTLLVALASLMSGDGERVTVIDTDPQGHLEAWARKGAAEVDWLREEDDERLTPAVKSLKRAGGHDVILIDTAGFKSAMAMHAIAAAQLVLIPSKASEADARDARRTFSHVWSVAETMDRDIPATVVLTDVDERTVIARAITGALDCCGVPRLKTVLLQDRLQRDGVDREADRKRPESRADGSRRTAWIRMDPKEGRLTIWGKSTSTSPTSARTRNTKPPRLRPHRPAAQRGKVPPRRDGGRVEAGAQGAVRLLAGAQAD